MTSSRTDDKTVLEAALSYAALGWAVFPLHFVRDGECTCGKTNCGSPGKHPANANGLSAATTDADQIRSWWHHRPDANIGVRTSAADGIWMLGPDGEQGLADLATLEARYGPLPATVRAESGTAPGQHYIFNWPADGAKIKNARNHRDTRIDIRGEGGIFVAAPSRNKNGEYRWLSSPHDVPLAAAPEWLVAWCRGTGADSGPRPDVGERARLYLRACPPAISGSGGHSQTFTVARAMVYGFDLGVERGLQLLLSDYNPRCVPAWSESELRHKCEDADAKPFTKPRGYLLGDTQSKSGGHTGGGDRGEQSETDSDWPRITRLDADPPTDPFPTDVFPPMLEAYCEQIAHCFNMPACHVGLGMLTIAGAAIGNSRRLRISASHEQHGALYSAIVAPPGRLKTPLLAQLTRPLHAAQDRWREVWKGRVEKWKKDNAGKGKGKEPSTPMPVLRRCVTTNATVESLLMLLRENQRGMLLLKDELSGLVASLNQYKAGKGDDKQVFLELWSGGSIDLDRKSDRTGDSLHVSRAFCAILGGLQPAVLDSLAGGQSKGGAMAPDDGYFDRWLPTYPPPKPAIGDDGRDVSAAALTAWDNTIDYLLNLGIDGDPSDPASWQGPRHVCMTPAAKAIWRDFTEQIATEINNSEGNSLPNLPNLPTPVGVWSKLTGHAGRLALIIHYMRWAGGGGAIDGEPGAPIIDDNDLEAAVRLAIWLKSHLRKVHRLAGQDETVSRARVLEAILKRNLLSDFSTIKRWQLHHQCRSRQFPTPESLDGPMELLGLLGYVRRCDAARKTLGGRAPDPEWDINPSI